MTQSLSQPSPTEPATPPAHESGLDVSTPVQANCKRSRSRVSVEVVVESGGDEAIGRRVTRSMRNNGSKENTPVITPQPLPKRRRTIPTISTAPPTPRLPSRTSNVPVIVNDDVPTTTARGRRKSGVVRTGGREKTPVLGSLAFGSGSGSSVQRTEVASDEMDMNVMDDVWEDLVPVSRRGKGKGKAPAVVVDEEIEVERNGVVESDEDTIPLATRRKGKGTASGKGKGKMVEDAPFGESDEDALPLATRRKGKGVAMKGKPQAVMESESEVSSLSELDGLWSDGERGAGPSTSQRKQKAKRATRKVKPRATRKGKNVNDEDVEDEVPAQGSSSSRKPAKASSSSRKPANRKRVAPPTDSESEFSGVTSDSESASSDSQDDDVDVTTAAPAAPRQRGRARGAAAAARRQAKQKQDIYAHHPELVTVWDQLEKEIQVITPQRAAQPTDVNVTLLPFQLEGLHWLMEQEQGRFAGGILADEMGMGKTIQMISLLVSRRMKPNLILTPTVAIMQWLAELNERTTKGLLKVLLFHGTNRPTTREELMEYDVVLSTYAIVEQGFRKENYGFKRKGVTVKEPSLLHSVDWARVVLDEAHAIKDRSCSTARAVFNLKRQKQWSLSGTPLQNRVGELYSLIRFMNANPFSYYFCKSCPCKMQTWSFSDRRHCDGCGHISHRHFCWWNAEILKPIQKYGAEGEGVVAFKKLGCLLDRIMLRRTKLERTEELGLPPRIVTVRRDVFNEAEEELYESLYTDSKRTFSTYVTNETVLNNYASIFSLLSRMRLAVNHPDLVTTRVARDTNTATSTLVCGICHEEAEDAIMSKCKHVFCREDARQYIQSAPESETPHCPVCFKPLTIDLSAEAVESRDVDTSEGVKSSIVNWIDLRHWRSSSKIEALVEELTTLQHTDTTSKSIVFSQFVAFLDLIQWRLSRAGFSVVKLDGRMSPPQRATVISKFMTDPTVTVFLVSLKAGGVALNLTEASRVFVMDPWWNPAVEDQAFDRIHRLGQYRPIKITRMVIENSIESRILQLQEKKKALFESTVGRDMEALAKLSEEDLRFLFVL